MEQTVLAPGDEIEVSVDEGSWGRTMNNLRLYGADAKSAGVTLSVESVAFSDGLLWNRGQLLRKDPENPNRWIPIDNVALGRLKEAAVRGLFLSSVQD